MTFCLKCGMEYDPSKSEASEPKKYCSQQCEEAAKAAENKI